MNKQRVFIAGAVMLACFVLLVYLFSGGEEKHSKVVKKFVSDQWDNTFMLDNKDPYGLSLFKEMTEDHCDSSLVVEDSINKYLDSTSTYIFAGTDFSLHSREFDSILRYVGKGSNLFLSYHELTNNLRNYFFYDAYHEWHFDDQQTVYTDQQSYHLYSIYQTDTVARIWNVIRPDNIMDTNFVVLTSIMETPNLIRLKHGKGNIYLNTTPELFVNYQMLTKDGFDHAQFVINQFPKSHQVKWLELGRLSDNFGNYDTDEMEGTKGRKDDSLLQFLFTKKELLIALLLTILGIILYLIFRTKRYWPVVPYLPKSKNRSLDFADTMTAIYFNQQSPYSILIVMRKNFRANVNRHFFLDISKQNNDAQLRLLSEKSGMDLQNLTTLVQLLENAKMQAVTYGYIQQVAKRQREFYLLTGIIKEKARIKSEQKKTEFKRQIGTASTLIFAGILFVLLGFNELAHSNGWGILLWPLGVVMLSAGAFLFNRKLLVLEQDKIIFYPYFSRRQEFELSEIMDVKAEKGFTIIRFTGNRSIKINHFEISYYSRRNFSKFISHYVR